MKSQMKKHQDQDSRTDPFSRPGIRANYAGLVTEIARLLDSARHVSVRAINAVMTATYWEIGRRIVRFEQGGKSRADYGQELLKRLAVDLTARFGRGFAERNLYQMRAFFQAYPEILQTVSAKSGSRKLQAVSAESARWPHTLRAKGFGACPLRLGEPP